jgi:GNAT superfamily N-acetyltransferase
MNEYGIEPARPEHLAVLPVIERAAAALFPAAVIPEDARDAVVPSWALAKAQAEGRLWVALAAGALPVGFAIVDKLGDAAFLVEIDVLPDHQCKGLGRALLERVIGWARDAGFAALELTTFACVPWNAPYYARLGFKVLDEGELSADLARLLNEEARSGLRERVAMRLPLDRPWWCFRYQSPSARP